MIQQSRRQTQPAAALDLTFHRRLAQRKRWHAKRLLAAVVALSVSLALWLLGWLVPLSWLWHGLLTLAAFGLGLLWPQPLDERWALRWIGRRVGLSYEALIELPAEAAYGLRAALEARALRALRRLELPRWQPWWLPLLCVALLVALLPRPAASVPLAPLGALPPSTAEQAAEAEPPVEAAPELLSPEEDEAELREVAEEAPELPQEAAPLLEGDASGAREAFGNGERATDEAALSRFLEQLAERRAEPAAEQNPFNSVRPLAVDELGRQRELREPSDGAEEGELDEASGTVAGGEKAPEDEASAEPGAGSGEGEEVQDTLPTGEAEGELPSEGSGAGDERASEPEAERGPGGQEGAGEPGEFGPDAGESQDGGGELGQLAAEGEGDEAPGLGRLEALPGELREGPTTIAGTVRLLEGEMPELDFEQLLGEFRRAEEQALREGRLPLEYQELIRNYFR